MESSDFLFNGEDYEGDNYNSSQFLDEEEEGDDRAPAMSCEFYERVEEFLKRAPPSIGEAILQQDQSSGIKTKRKNSKRNEEESTNKNNNNINNKNKLPKVMPDPYSHVEAKVAVPKKKKNQENVYNASNHNNNKSIDPQLLKDAFAFTDNLLKNALLEEAQEQQQQQQQSEYYQKAHHNSNNSNNQQGKLKKHPYSAPAEINSDRDYLYQGNNSKSKSEKSGHVNILKKLKSNKNSQSSSSHSQLSRHHQESSNTTEFTLGKEELETKRNPINFDELVSNFQQGTTLERLRKELEESQRSLATSSQAIKHLSKQFMNF
jgi:hypothetical protein